MASSKAVWKAIARNIMFVLTGESEARSNHLHVSRDALSVAENLVEVLGAEDVAEGRLSEESEGKSLERFKLQKCRLKPG